MLIRTSIALVVAVAAIPLHAAEKLTATELIALAHKKSRELPDALRSTLGQDKISKGTAFAGEGPDFIWAIESDRRPDIYLDGRAAGPMTRAGKSNLWFYPGKLGTGTAHGFYYMIQGTRTGGSTDVPAYGPDSYPKKGVAEGVLSDKIVHTSKIYGGMQSNYWIYVPAGYDARTPAALMVWQDGENLIKRDGASRTLTVVDNLIAQKKIPITIQVFIQPGMTGEKRMRSIEYDTVSDRYARFLRDEILADVEAKYNIRKDAYSRAIAGISSGGICAFNVAWQQPDQFSRVLSHVGSFTSIQWRHDEADPRENILGGNDFPFLIRKSPKRNIRVWLQDGSEDLENDHGSWPLQNIQMANSLKMREYDFHFSFGGGSHNAAHGNAELPAELTWLWRDYDPAKTQQDYQMDPAEKSTPMFRVHIYNR
ncbi:MAG TPA: alpha/beta hydrolase-fold protein [Bryobacteraceae bacterium]|nr:alpha/beta hydrolase-fold protein [Bryobacteraceae bacterium]